MQYNAPQIVAAFQDANTQTKWGARSYTTESIDTVHFIVPSSLIKITLDCHTGEFLITFHKLHAAWGDYIRAITRALVYILKTVQAGGLDVDAPDHEEAAELTLRTTRMGQTAVRIRSI